MSKKSAKSLAKKWMQSETKAKNEILIYLGGKKRSQLFKDTFASLVGLTISSLEKQIDRVLNAQKYRDISESFYNSTAQKDIYHRPHRRTQKKELTVLK